MKWSDKAMKSVLFENDKMSESEPVNVDALAKQILKSFFPAPTMSRDDLICEMIVAEKLIQQLKIPKYDKTLSLEYYLRNNGVSDDDVKEIMSHKYPCVQARGYFSKKMMGTKITAQNIDDINNEFFANTVATWTLENGPHPIREVEAIVANILRHLTKYVKNYDSSAEFIYSIQFLLALQHWELSEGFIIAYKRTGKDIESIVSDIVMHVYSCTKTFDHFYTQEENNLVVIRIINLLCNACNVNKFKFKLLKDNEINQSIRFDLTKSVGIGHDYFLPNTEQQKEIQKDIEVINGFLKQASELSNKFPKQQIESVRFADKKPDEMAFRDYTSLYYAPDTPTGKPAKYPISTQFVTKEGTDNVQSDIFGTIEYLQDNSIGKFRIICWVRGKCYQVHGIKKRDILEISKIETSDKDGLLDILYKR
jgi:hypothetical protein